MLFLSAGVAGLYHVQVHPERRKGIGTALTLVPMHDARKAGYEISVLQASKMGEPVYRKIGFERCERGAPDSTGRKSIEMILNFIFHRKITRVCYAGCISDLSAELMIH